MRFTLHDLGLAASRLATLERFVARQRVQLQELPWTGERLREGRELLAQFEAMLRTGRERYDEVWNELNQWRFEQETTSEERSIASAKERTEGELFPMIATPRRAGKRHAAIFKAGPGK